MPPRHEESRRARHWTDYVSYSALAAIALSFPIATAAVFWFSADRVITSHVLSVNFTLCIYIALLVPFLRNHVEKNHNNQVAGREPSLSPLTKTIENNRPLHDVVRTWVFLSCVIHCTWELGWLLLHKTIRQNRDDPLYYAWTAYIDGGDARYATDPISTLVWCLECVSVLNGIVGYFALDCYGWSRYYDVSIRRKGSAEESRKLKNMSLVLFVVFATYHLASCSIYFLSEIVEGCPNVNLDSWFDTWVKFFWVNSPWLVFPWFVLKWVIEEM